jgi:hypothetical protein
MSNSNKDVLLVMEANKDYRTLRVVYNEYILKGIEEGIVIKDINDKDIISIETFFESDNYDNYENITISVKDPIGVVDIRPVLKFFGIIIVGGVGVESIESIEIKKMNFRDIVMEKEQKLATPLTEVQKQPENKRGGVNVPYNSTQEELKKKIPFDRFNFDKDCINKFETKEYNDDDTYGINCDGLGIELKECKTYFSECLLTDNLKNCSNIVPIFKGKENVKKIHPLVAIKILQKYGFDTVDEKGQIPLDETQLELVKNKLYIIENSMGDKFYQLIDFLVQLVEYVNSNGLLKPDGTVCLKKVDPLELPSGLSIDIDDEDDELANTYEYELYEELGNYGLP